MSRKSRSSYTCTRVYKEAIFQEGKTGEIRDSRDGEKTAEKGKSPKESSKSLNEFVLCHDIGHYHTSL